MAGGRRAGGRVRRSTWTNRPGTDVDSRAGFKSNRLAQRWGRSSGNSGFVPGRLLVVGFALIVARVYALPLANDADAQWAFAAGAMFVALGGFFLIRSVSFSGVVLVPDSGTAASRTIHSQVQVAVDGSIGLSRRTSHAPHESRPRASSRPRLWSPSPDWSFVRAASDRGKLGCFRAGRDCGADCRGDRHDRRSGGRRCETLTSNRSRRAWRFGSPCS